MYVYRGRDGKSLLGTDDKNDLFLIKKKSLCETRLVFMYFVYDMYNICAYIYLYIIYNIAFIRQ